MFFKRKKAKVEIVKKYTQPVATWGGSGIVFRVINGKGLLCEKYGSLGNQGLHCLTFGDIPLIKFHGDEYMCPTCQKLISAGYGLDNVSNPTIQNLQENINSPFESLEKSLEDLSLLFGLLPSGFYALVDTELYPTDGTGNFFWTVTNTPEYNETTCPVFEDGNWMWEYPAFILPSQPPNHYNPERAEYYQSNPECRAITYNLGFLNVLIDGHHKAVAAALQGRKVKTLVIIPTTGLSLPQNDQNSSKLIIGGEPITLKDLGTNPNEMKAIFPNRRLNDRETKHYLSKTNNSFDNYSWPQTVLDTAKKYPTAHDLAYQEWAGDFSEERLMRIINKQEFPEEDDMFYLCGALYYMEHPKFCEVAFRVGKDKNYVRIWHNVFMLLTNIQSEAVENFFIDYLINDDKRRPDVTKIADEYLKRD